MTGRVEDLLTQINAVRSRPGYLAFCSLVGQRLAASRSQDVLHMLIGIGAPPDVAWQILEGWGGRLERAVARSALQLDDPIEVTPVETSALRLAAYVPGWIDHDWPALLTRACAAVKEKPE